MRVGMGYDVHKLVEGRDLILGGVTVPHTLGLLGHSDADVLVHAIMDALLGAAMLAAVGLMVRQYLGAPTGENEGQDSADAAWEDGAQAFRAGETVNESFDYLDLAEGDLGVVESSARYYIVDDLVHEVGD